MKNKMKNREIVWIVIIVVLIGTLIISNKEVPSKFDENAFQKRIDSLSLIVEKNNKLCDSLQLDNDKRQSKIGELSNRLTKLNEKFGIVYKGIGFYFSLIIFLGLLKKINRKSALIIYIFLIYITLLHQYTTIFSYILTKK
jgi:hypothetical protein